MYRESRNYSDIVEGISGSSAFTEENYYYLFSTGVVAMLFKLVPIFAEQPGYLRHALSGRTRQSL